MHSIKEFCRIHGISEALYYDLQRKGVGPEVVCIGKRRLITPESALAWLKQQPKRPPQPAQSKAA